MGHYRSNLRDIQFNLFEVFEASDRFGKPPFEGIDAQTAREILKEVEDLASGEIADAFADSDRHPPVFDPDTGTVTISDGFKKAYRRLMDGEWYRLDLPSELGGYGAPRSLVWAAAELLIGSNPAAYIYMTCGAFAHALYQMGTDKQKALAAQMVDHRWGATMVLTEPDAGSDVGAGRTKAAEQPDGTWHIEGVKRFITSGDHDLSDNIIHFVLARPEGGVAGTKGLSMFIVPKFLVNADGSLGARNGVATTNLEHKMGLKSSTTCELTFGGKHPAVGYLVGDVHDGIRQMFKIIEYARMMVGTKAIATLSTGYLNALEYAKSRVQGADLTRMADKTAPRVTITHHPDVRRSLMRQKAYAEGLRALVLYTAAVQDQILAAQYEGDEETAKRLDGLNDLLLPIVKGCGSERSYELLGAESLQTFGGSGYLQDYPLEQYIRDAKIDTLYEGTTAIQGMDLFFRKIVRDNGQALGALAGEIEVFIEEHAALPQMATLVEALRKAMGDVQAMVETMIGWLMASQEKPEEIYKVGLNTTRLLMSFGDLIVGWLLAHQASVATKALETRPSEKDLSFYEGKVAAARFFSTTVLPELTSRRHVLEATTNELMDLQESAF